MTRARKTKILGLIALVLTLPFLPHACSSAPLWYEAEPIEAWVVDEETDKPLADVIVVAHWQLEGGLEGGTNVGQMMVMETVTDSKGHFRFSAWGPKSRPWNVLWGGTLKTRSPGLILFKTGYRYRGLENDTTEKAIRGELDNPLRSIWTGKTIKLEKFEGEWDEYARHLLSLNTSLDFVLLPLHGNPCEWEQTPRILMALYAEQKSLEERKIRSFSSPQSFLLANDSRLVSKGCRSPKDFLNETDNK